jgi:hypothetical protein
MKGCIPEAPDGGHSTHAGMPLDGVVTALPEDPPEAAREDAAVPGVLDRPPEAPPVDGAPPTDPVAEPPVVVLGVAWVAVAGFAEIVEGPDNAELPVPSVTMPLRVTPPGVAAVCANAGQAATIETSTA